MTVRHGNRTGDWNTTAASGLGPRNGLPLSSTDPAEYGNSPASTLSSVDFPHPLWPTTETNSPS
jgi:hypothetical protein